MTNIRAHARRPLMIPIVGLMSIGLAFPISALIAAINQRFGQDPGQAVLLVAASLGLLILLPPLGYLLLRRSQAEPVHVALLALGSTGVAMVGIYLYWVSFYIYYPADFLIWSESDFVNDILKFRIGYPLYTDQINNESFNYPPGAQLLTYFLARLVGRPLSIPVYRQIQILYVVVATFLAVASAFKLVAIAQPDSKIEHRNFWLLILFPFLFLIGTNRLTNPFVHNLHNDSLAQLIAMLSFYLLLLYILKPSTTKLVLMGLLPVIGFMVKQSLAIWGVFFLGYLLIFQRPRSLKRILLLASLSFGGILLALGIAYLLWGGNYYYWTIYVLSQRGVSILRSIQNLLDIWPYAAMILFAGLVLLRGKRYERLAAVWLIAVAFLLSEIYTSGIAWMKNHIGPGSLIAGVWFFAALMALWPVIKRQGEQEGPLFSWLYTMTSFAVVGLFLTSLGIVRIPVQTLSDDAYRYYREIEAEFEGLPADKVLLDAGTWVYLDDQVVMKDRAPAIGERGYSQTGDFSGFIQRIENHDYDKILVRKLHKRDFWYDHFLWPASSGIRDALLENYVEVKQIEPVEGDPTYLFSEISVLVPKP